MTTSVSNNTNDPNYNPYSVVNGTGSGSSSSSSSGASASVDPNSAQAIQDRFLKLLTTQLTAQDPTNPMDNSQITSQMAQISSVTGLQNLNQSMQQLLQSQMSSQSLLAANTVGRQAMVASNSLAWDANTKGTSTVGMVSLASAADQMTVTIQNAAGQTVGSLDVSKPQAGMNTFSWDGKDSAGNVLPAGYYSFNAVATKAGANGAEQVAATPYANETIAGVTWDSAGTPQLVLNSGKRVGMSEVQMIS